MEERTLRSTRPWEGKRIAVRVDEVERSDGHRTTREIVVHPGAVGIVAWDGERLALVRQWRHAAGRALLEIPAGTLEPDEEAAVTARRELAEEAGLAATGWEQGPGFYPAPGFSTEFLRIYLATGLSEVTAGGDEDESLEPSWLPLDEALAAVEDGRIADAKSITGILWLARRLAST